MMFRMEKMLVLHVVPYRNCMKAMHDQMLIREGGLDLAKLSIAETL